MASSPRHVALLRGINVGGKNKLPMRELVTMFEGAGCTEVNTYIQSGNVVFAATSKVVKTLPAVITAAIEKRFGLRIPVVLRSAKALATVAATHPLPAGDGEDAWLYVAFLAATPTTANVARLDPRRSPPDTFLVRGADIYLSLPNGARSKLTNAYFDRTLNTVSTMRNWRTVQALRELVGATG